MKQNLHEEIQKMLKIQEQTMDHSPYMVGMYNGIEAVLSVAEEREPKFLDCWPMQFNGDLDMVVNWAKETKPQDRSEQARYHSIFITELEKVIAFHKTYVIPAITTFPVGRELPVSVPEGMMNPGPVFVTVNNAPIEGSKKEQSNPLDRMFVGAIVHYVFQTGECRPAVIVRIWDHEHINGCCNLVVLTDGSNDAMRSVEDAKKDAVTTLWQTSRLYSEKQEPLTWHWPE